MTVVPAPVDWVQSVSQLRLPARADERLQQLMDRDTHGLLRDEERPEFESLVELSELLSVIRAQALQLLIRTSR